MEEDQKPTRRQSLLLDLLRQFDMLIRLNDIPRKADQPKWRSVAIGTPEQRRAVVLI